MTLRYSKKTDEIQIIEERLKTMSLAHKIVIREDEVTPMLVEGKREYVGIEAMNGYLDLLSSEREQWYYCDC